MLRHSCLWTTLVLVLPWAVQAEPVKYFPNDTEIVVTIDLQQILNSELVKSKKDLLEGAKGKVEEKVPKEARKWIDELGIDIFKDITSITLATPFTKEPEQMLFIVSGKFNKNKVEATGKKAVQQFADVIKADTVGKRTLYTVTPPDGKKPGYISLLDDETIAISGSEEAVKNAIARADGKKGKLAKELGQLMKTADANQAFGFVATNSGLTKAVEEAANQNPQAAVAAEAIKQIDGAGAGVTLTKDINFQVGVLAKDAASAKQFAQQAQVFGLPAIRQMAANKAEGDPKFALLHEVAKTLQVRNNATAVILQGRITAEVLEKAMKLVPGLGGN